jgi:hypothetical protein
MDVAIDCPQMIQLSVSTTLGEGIVGAYSVSSVDIENREP